MTDPTIIGRRKASSISLDVLIERPEAGLNEERDVGDDSQEHKAPQERDP